VQDPYGLKEGECIVEGVGLRVVSEGSVCIGGWVGRFFKEREGYFTCCSFSLNFPGSQLLHMELASRE
jgi:hypothetical protein